MREITYTETADGVRSEQLEGFFVGWPKPPTAEVHLKLLRASDCIVLAWMGERVVGYATALSDGVLFSVVTSIEVLPEFQGRGLGRELMNRMLARLGGVYATDLVCDEGVAPFYEGLGMRRLTGMGIRRYERQDGV